MTLLAERPSVVVTHSDPGVPFDVKSLDLTSYEEFAGRMHFTRETCDFLERVGMLSDRYELLDGEIIIKAGQNLPHAVTVSRITFYLMSIWGPDQVLNQTTMEVTIADQTTNRPEPDVYVLDRLASEFRGSPLGSNILLAVEVADSTLRSDLMIKSFLYARAGVPEFWVMDVNGRKLYLHREFTEGVYTSVSVVTEDEEVATLASPDKTIRVADLLAPVTPAN